MDIPKILYEDNHILVAIKPVGILSQADITGSADMLTLLKNYLCRKYNKPGEAYLGLLHRLDRPVSGVMVFAKTSKCASRISAQIREHKMDKRYRVIVRGVPEKEEETLHSYIVKDEEKNQVTVISKDSPDVCMKNARESILIYTKKGSALREGPGGARTLSLLEVQLITGRSHQIRAQLSDAGFPIVGDRKYGPDDNYYRGEICLEAFSLSFFHPVTGEKMTFDIPISHDDPWNLFIHEDCGKGEQL